MKFSDTLILNKGRGFYEGHVPLCKGDLEKLWSGLGDVILVKVSDTKPRNIDHSQKVVYTYWFGEIAWGEYFLGLDRACQDILDYDFGAREKRKLTLWVTVENL